MINEFDIILGILYKYDYLCRYVILINQLMWYLYSITYTIERILINCNFQPGVLIFF